MGSLKRRVPTKIRVAVIIYHGTHHMATKTNGMCGLVGRRLWCERAIGYSILQRACHATHFFDVRAMDIPYRSSAVLL